MLDPGREVDEADLAAEQPQRPQRHDVGTGRPTASPAPRTASTDSTRPAGSRATPPRTMARNTRLWRKCVWLRSMLTATTANVVAVATRVHSPIVISTAAAAPTHSMANHTRSGSSGSHAMNGSQKWSV